MGTVLSGTARRSGRPGRDREQEQATQLEPSVSHLPVRVQLKHGPSVQLVGLGEAAPNNLHLLFFKLASAIHTYI